MSTRVSAIALLALLAATAVSDGDAQGPQKYYCASMCSRKDLPCPSPCHQCPKVPSCPAPFCPHPECPYIPHLHPCPEPVCAPLPRIPACPTPTVNLSCPHVACPKHSCPVCPKCPDILPCPVCPTTVLPTTTTTRIPTTTTVPRTSSPRTTVHWQWTHIINADAETATAGRNTSSSPTTERAHPGTTTKTTASVAVSNTAVSGSPTTTPETAVIGTTANLPEGYVRTPGIGAFKYVGLKKSWYEANRTCAQDGAYLAIPNSKDELDLLKRMMVSQNKDIIHVGFNAQAVGVFGTVLGQNMTTLERTLWATGEPTGGPAFGCTYLARRGLVTERCSDLEVFICEIA